MGLDQAVLKCRSTPHFPHLPLTSSYWMNVLLMVRGKNAEEQAQLSKHFASISANISLVRVSHVVKPNICGVEKYTLPLVEGTAKSQRVDTAKAKAAYTGKGEELRTLKQLTTYGILNIISAKVFCLN